RTTVKLPSQPGSDDRKTCPGTSQDGAAPAPGRVATISISSLKSRLLHCNQHWSMRVNASMRSQNADVVANIRDTCNSVAARTRHITGFTCGCQQVQFGVCREIPSHLVPLFLTKVVSFCKNKGRLNVPPADFQQCTRVPSIRF